MDSQGLFWVASILYISYALWQMYSEKKLRDEIAYLKAELAKCKTIEFLDRKPFYAYLISPFGLSSVSEEDFEKLRELTSEKKENKNESN